LAGFGSAKRQRARPSFPAGENHFTEIEWIVVWGNFQDGNEEIETVLESGESRFRAKKKGLPVRIILSSSKSRLMPLRSQTAQKAHTPGYCRLRQRTLPLRTFA
jgi:hypothetical protein